jgi:hypothetical protein
MLSYRRICVNLRFIDWIWRVRGSLALAPGQSTDEVFGRLAPLFNQTGTSHQRTTDTLTFKKKDQAAQDKMSVFDGGVLKIEKGALSYVLISRALLFCFLAPVLFLAIAQFTTVIAKLDKPPHESAKKHTPPAAMNPIDKALGAPAPDKSKKDDDEEGGGKKGKKLTPTAAYVFAGIFAALYVVGRILEDRLIRRVFAKALAGGLNEVEAPRTEHAAQGAA